MLDDAVFLLRPIAKISNFEHSLTTNTIIKIHDEI